MEKNNSSAKWSAGQIVVIVFVGIVSVVAMVFGIMSYLKHDKSTTSTAPETKKSSAQYVRLATGKDLNQSLLDGSTLEEGDTVLSLRDSDQGIYKYSNGSLNLLDFEFIEGMLIIANEGPYTGVQWVVTRKTSNLGNQNDKLQGNISDRPYDLILIPSRTENLRNEWVSVLSGELDENSFLKSALKLDIVTPSFDGFMSAEDKQKLDSIEEKANRVTAASDLSVVPGGNLSASDLQSAVIELQNSIDRNTTTTATRPPTNTDDNSNGLIVGSIWIDETTGLHYVCVDSTTNSAVWKETTSVSVSGLQWHIQKNSVQGGNIDSLAAGWVAREFDDTMLLSSGSEISLLPQSSSPKTQIQIINTQNVPISYNLSAKGSGRNIGHTEIRWQNVSGSSSSTVSSSVYNSDNNNQVYPEILHKRFEVPAVTTSVFELQQLSAVSGTVPAGLGFASSTAQTVFVDVVITKVS